MNIAIVENEINDLEELVSFIKKYFELHPSWLEGELVIDTFTNGYDFLECNKIHDIIFMDIEIPGIDGMEVSKKLRKRDDDVPLVFVSRISRRAIEGYKVKASDFILKPVNYHDLKIVLDMLMATLKKDNKDTFFVFKVRGLMMKINQADVETVEMDGHDVVLRYYVGQDIRTISFRSTMKDIVKKIEYPHLISTSSGSIINLMFVTSFDNVNSTCTLKSGRKIFISRSHKKEFVLRLSRY